MKWARMKLRTLMLLVVGVALGSGWLVRHYRDAEAQRQTVDALRSGGAFPWYDYESMAGKPTGVRRPYWHRWLVRRFGPDFFCRVVRVDFDVAASDSELVHVASLSQLEELGLARSRVTNQGLIHLAGLTKLRVLDLEDTSVDDRSLVHLKGLSSLQSLNLNETDVSDASLARLAGFPKPEELHLAETAIGDAELVHLQKLNRLRILDLRQTRVTDRGLVHLMGMKNLELLDAGATMVTDFGAHDLREALPKVKVLFDRTGF